MKYDFDTYHSRRDMEAAKWDAMDASAGQDIVPLSVADMELLTAPEIIDELKKTAEFGMYGYTWWGERYAEAVEYWMRTRHDWEIKKDWIIQLNGVVQGIYAAVRAFSNPGDGILVQTPVYYPFYRAITMNKRNILENELCRVDGKYVINFDDFEQKAKKAKMFILCNPHNPVGRVWTADELEKMGEICLKHHVLVVSDEIHFDVIMPSCRHTVFAGISDAFAQSSITLNSASKTFSLASLCTANAFVPNKKIYDRYDEEINISGCYTYSLFGVRALETGYTKCADWVDQLNAHIYKNYQRFRQFMSERYPDVWVAQLEGTYLAWFDCRCFGLGGEELGAYLRREAQLYLDDGYIFGKSGEGYERINLACTTKVLDDALDRFDRAMLKISMYD